MDTYETGQIRKHLDIVFCFKKHTLRSLRHRILQNANGRNSIGGVNNRARPFPLVDVLSKAEASE